MEATWQLLALPTLQCWLAYLSRPSILSACTSWCSMAKSATTRTPMHTMAITTMTTKNHSPHESPWVVTVPLILLAIPSVVIGFMTIQPMLFGEFFKDAIFIDAEKARRHENIG
jgi:NADH:ubiquinone oxidoreductase subunit 5 (subunit L)/multisubunit Na+/H+ antiporter MnhA subunit